MIFPAYILWYFQIHQALYPGKQIYKDYINGFLYPLASSWVEPIEDPRRGTEVKEECAVDWITAPQRYPHLNPQNLWTHCLLWNKGICVGRILRLGDFSVLPLGKWKCRPLSQVHLFATLWTVAFPAPLSVEFHRQQWSGLPFPSPGDLPDPGIEPGSPALQADSFTAWAPREAWWAQYNHKVLYKRETGGLKRENEGNGWTEERAESQRETWRCYPDGFKDRAKGQEPRTASTL